MKKINLIIKKGLIFIIISLTLLPLIQSQSQTIVSEKLSYIF